MRALDVCKKERVEGLGLFGSEFVVVWGSVLRNAPMGLL